MMPGNVIMKKHKKAFTLVELLIAVGLLSLIMMLLLQLFSGAQKMWIASEKTNNVYADARVAMELMADLINTVQFSHGEKLDSAGDVVRDTDTDMIFSLTTGEATDGNYSSSIYFISKTARDLPKNSTNPRFISFRLDEGKLLMTIYSDENSDFYGFFPTYGTGTGTGTRDTAFKNGASNLKNKMDALAPGDDDNGGEKKECQIIAENVVSFKLTAYTLNNSGKLEAQTGTSADLVKEPPYMVEMQLAVLDRDSYTRWKELSGNAKTAYLDQHKRTFTRNVFIGDRWSLEAQKKIVSGD